MDDDTGDDWHRNGGMGPNPLAELQREHLAMDCSPAFHGFGSTKRPTAQSLVALQRPRASQLLDIALAVAAEEKERLEAQAVEELQPVYKALREAAERGEFSIEWNGMSANAETLLRRDGYIVKQPAMRRRTAAVLLTIGLKQGKDEDSDE